jgi:hypothetical protein
MSGRRVDRTRELAPINPPILTTAGSPVEAAGGRSWEVSTLQRALQTKLAASSVLPVPL